MTLHAGMCYSAAGCNSPNISTRKCIVMTRDKTKTRFRRLIHDVLAHYIHLANFEHRKKKVT